MSEWTRAEIVSYIKKDLLLEQLDLANSGVALEDIEDDTPLLNDGLDIDSVGALDLLVGLEKKFDLRLPEFGKDFIEATCKNVGCLADYVVANLAKDKRARVS
jgi:acyl carrier protein